MPSIAAFHPQIVHFAVALLIVGVLLRLVSLTGRLAFTNAAATTLIALGTAASFVAVVSGTQAHGPVERVPGVRAAVVEHEEWGVLTRNIFLIVTGLEAVTLALVTLNHRFGRPAAMITAAIGVVGLGALYETAEHGGELVYGYAGGVGIRSGDPQDVNRLLVAGVYHQAMQDSESGNPQAASELVDATARRFPDHLELQLFSVEWQLTAKKDPGGALQRLDALPLAQADAPLRVRAGLLRARALLTQGNKEGARAVLQTLKADNPDNAQIQRQLDELK
jgi:uncharacterized membrane protein